MLFKKFKQLSFNDISRHIELLIKYTKVVTLKPTDIKNALSIKERYQIQWYDSLIIAAAIQSQCKILYTEDMQNGLGINNTLTIVNPFTN